MNASAAAETRFPLVGNPAPVWKAIGYLEGEYREYSSEELHGKWYMLFFYPNDFTPI
ncbi:redoxin domain-containing protein [bacterium]|nr:redoxin domain-containing protein [bacterium]